MPDVLVIPAQPGRRAYSIEVDLDGGTFKLAFNWNIRDSAWYVSIYDITGAPVRLGQKVTIDTPLLHGCSAENQPLGDLIAVNTTGVDADPGLDDLGGDVPLLYVQVT